MLWKKAVFRNFTKFKEKHLCWSLFLWSEGLKGCNFVKKRLQHKCFPVDFAAKLLKTASYGTPPVATFDRFEDLKKFKCLMFSA